MEINTEFLCAYSDDIAEGNIGTGTKETRSLDSFSNCCYFRLFEEGERGSLNWTSLHRQVSMHASYQYQYRIIIYARCEPMRELDFIFIVK